MRVPRKPRFCANSAIQGLLSPKRSWKSARSHVNEARLEGGQSKARDAAEVFLIKAQKLGIIFHGGGRNLRVRKTNRLLAQFGGDLCRANRVTPREIRDRSMSGNRLQITRALVGAILLPGEQAIGQLLPDRGGKFYRVIRPGAKPRRKVKFAFLPGDQRIGVNVNVHWPSAFWLPECAGPPARAPCG